MRLLLFHYSEEMVTKCEMADDLGVSRNKPDLCLRLFHRLLVFLPPPRLWDCLAQIMEHNSISPTRHPSGGSLSRTPPPHSL